MQSRNQSIDILRGIAIYLIVWPHVSLGWLLDDVINITVLGVFFCISGFFYKKTSFKTLLANKSGALLKPWLIFTAIGYIYHFLAARFVDHVPFRFDMVFVDLVKGCDFETNIPCWFFIALFEVFVLYHILEKLPFIARTLVIVPLFFSGQWLLSCDINWFYISKSCLYLLFFYTGVLIKERRQLIIKDKSMLAAIYILGAVLALVVKVCVFRSNVLGLFSAILIFMAMLEIDAAIQRYADNWAIRAITYIGRNSLVIFALHIITNDLIWRVLYPVFHTPSFFLSTGYAVLSILLCLPAIPVYNYLFNRGKIGAGELPAPIN